MKKVFISQPMNGVSDEDIYSNRNKYFQHAMQLANEPLELVDSMLTECNVGPVWCLGRSICLMEQADCAYFAPGWEKARGCKIEHDVAIAYGIEVLYE